MEIIIRNKKGIPSAVRKLLKYSGRARIFAFNGQMGSGKTTIIKAFCRELGAEDIAVSPTFTLINEYRSKVGSPVFHIDLYRLKNIAEAFDLGIEEYLSSTSYCFIEWPALIADLLPEDRIWIDIMVGENEERVLSVS